MTEVAMCFADGQGCAGMLYWLISSQFKPWGESSNVWGKQAQVQMS